MDRLFALTPRTACKPWVAVIGMVFCVSACSDPSGSGASSLVTGSIFSSAPKAAANPDDPARRPTRVALVSASAVKCGFYFDPAKLRQSLLTTQTAGEQLAKAQKSYDDAFARTSKALADQNDFCTEGQVADLKSDLNRHLAGDFTAVAKVDKGPKSRSAWEWLTDSGQKADAGKLDRNEVFFPSGGAQTATPR